MGKKLGIFGLAVIFGLPLAAWAEPQVGIKVVAEKEIKVEQNGKTFVKRVKAETVEPGEIVFYTLKYENKGDQKATDVVVNNAVPDGTVFLPESTYGKGSTIFYSIDKGKTFNKPEALRVFYTLHNGKKMTRQAYTTEYTHIKWIVGEVPPGGSGVLGYQVKVK